MITRNGGYLHIRDGEVPATSAELERDGCAVIRGAFSASEVETLRADIERVFDDSAPEARAERRGGQDWEPFRYEMLNRSEAARAAVSAPVILDALEPLLGEDFHIIANTAWRQSPEPSTHGGRYWHIDAGPHVPRPPGIAWDDRIPYPVFAVAAHILLIDCPLDAGPTGVLPGSHRSGLAPPHDRLADDDLTWEGTPARPLTGEAGDVALFVSDAWHRRLPSGPADPGRFFLQCHYGRRDLAQRVRPTSAVNHLSDEAVAWAGDDRRRRALVGLHAPGFYDG